MEKLALDYSNMSLVNFALWLVILTGVGFAARKIVRGKAVFGFWGDAIFGLLGVFLLGTLMNAFNFSLTSTIMSIDLGPLNSVTTWVEIAIVAFVGSLLLRAVLRPITG